MDSERSKGFQRESVSMEVDGMNVDTQINAEVTAPELERNLKIGFKSPGSDKTLSGIKSEFSTEISTTTTTMITPGQNRDRAVLQTRLQSNKQDASFVCVVCTDKASGYHYGVPACEGCKAFFKRSLQSKEINYKCPASSNCIIDKMSRKCCQACRLKKCHDMGMSKEFLGSKIKKPKPDRPKAVRNKRKTEKLSVSISESDADGFVGSTISAHEVELENMIQNLTQLHSEFYFRTEEMDVSPPPPLPLLSTENENAIDLKDSFCDTVGHQLVQIIDWAKQLPGYCKLVLSDQAILLQAAWVDLLVLNWLFHSVHTDESLRLSHKLNINFTQAQQIGFENIYSHIISLVMRAKKYNIDEEEISCLKAISLTNAESSSLTGPDKVSDLITTFSSALQYYTSNRHRDSPQKFAKLVLILPQLKYLVNQLIEFLYTLKINSNGSNLSDLVIEMLEAKQRL